MQSTAGGPSEVPLSPPGAMSQRTDLPTQGAMPIPDAAYGEQQEFMDIQGGAPMAGAAPVGMFDPTMQPDVPVTSGANYGAGPGLDAVQTPDVMKADVQLIAQYLPALERVEKREDTPESFRKFVRYIRGLA